MIGKGKSISHTGNAINYAVEKHKAELIDKHNLIGETGKEVEAEFKMCQNLNGRCENNTLSFVLSPSIDDGEKLNDANLLGIANEFLEKMNLSSHQAIILKHQDKKHKHLHIYVNRIGFDGKAYKDNHIGKASQRVAHEVAKSKGLTCARDVEELNKENTKGIRKEIGQRMDQLIKDHKPRNFDDFKDLCKASKIDLFPTINKKTGQFQGYRVGFDQFNFKASEIGKKFTLSNLEIAFKSVKTLRVNKGFSNGF
ncbi:hypothetical protein BZG02_20445 [Labilibaculum filiforme]|uniref:MobA/VirD2-like nuclease domain-containing protein n=1 Tax=Labilibaculum filiforme TaxID=1940526 RepID=A0A2N3HQ58_9BACT|nr:relaxase/mobilization nuclease domain-containing protein [Labilibaculum filiforme]PKQ60181.1 hypothetical protein BZG02_20445 [Labilibaculum filiforme]